MIQPEIFESPSKLHIAAAELWMSRCSAAIESHGSFHVALSGGTTPKALFQLLASEDYASHIPWDKIHFYFGDERFVPQDHQDSNFKMANDAMLSKLPYNPHHVHAVATSLPDATAAANAYAEILATNLPKDENGNQHFDLVLLGLGPDGHTASLFPDTQALDEMEKTCTAVYVEKFKSWRTTITYPVINAAREILLLSEGEGKADIVQDLLVNKKDANIYPIQRVKPSGKIHWYIDKAAAKNLM